MKRILVTGASGLVGNAIYEELRENAEDFELFCLGNKGFRNKALGEKENFVAVDITNKSDVSKLEKLGEVDAVIHSAGLAHQFQGTEPEQFWKVNVEGTINVAELAAKLSAEHFVLISSVSVYGGSDGVEAEKKEITEEAACNPKGAYAISKFEAEKAAQIICEREGIPLSILRLATVIGEEDKGNVLRLIRAIDRRRFFWLGHGDNFKSLIYKADVAKACRLVLEKKAAGKKTEIYNVSAKPVKMREVVSEISGNLEKKVPQIKIDEESFRKLLTRTKKNVRIVKILSLIETLEKWLSDELYSAEKIGKNLGFAPQTSIKEALRKEVEWYLGK